MPKGSVLVIDDEPGLLDVLEWELSSFGYDVLACSSGTAAVEVLQQSEFDVVISDVRMPGLSGLDVLRRTKELAPETEVIIATGYAEMETVVECVRGGAFDFVQKPFNLPSVIATVDRAIERRNLRASSKLYEASLAISANRDVQALPELIVSSALKILDADSAVLWLPQKDGTVYMAKRVTRPGFETSKVPVPTTAIDRIARLGRPKLLPVDAGGDEELALKNATGIVYPLKVADRLAGVMSMGRFGLQRPFRRGDVERASALASQVLLALENVRLSTQAAASERLATIGQLAAGVAHEINNPVSYVLMSLEAATELTHEVFEKPELRADFEQALKDAMEGAGRIRDIASDLKNMSRSEGANNKRRIDLNEVVRAALRISGAELRHRTEVVLELEEGLAVEGDAGRLTQVLVNLLVNSAHAMAHRPIKENRVTVRSWRDGEKLRVSVKDNGPGISLDNQQRIFDAFFTTKAPGVGTGLGLPISRDIARAHGGDVELVSAPGEGACFIVSLPPAPAAAKNPAKREELATVTA